MLIDLASRFACHALEFGYLVEPGSGRTLRHLGRHATRRTADFPTGCFPLALPGRLASYVNALPYAIDPLHHEAGAVVVSPAYLRDGEGRLAPVSVTIQRVGLFAEEDRHDLPGDAVRSAALTIDWIDFGRHVGSLGGIVGTLRAARVPAENRDHRLDRPRPIFTAAPAFATALAPAGLAILGAVRRGARLRLDARWLFDEAAFLAAFLGALAALPEPLRGHVSAAAGVVSPDNGIQIAWALDETGLDPASAMAAGLVADGEAVVAGAAPADARAFSLADDPDFVELDGLVAASFEAPGLHARVRAAMRACFAPPPGRPMAPAAAAALLEAFADGGDMTPAVAERLIGWAAGAGRDDRRAFAAATLPGAARTAALLLCGERPAEPSLDGIATAVELRDLAEDCGEVRGADRLRDLAGDLLGTKLSDDGCPSQEALDRIAARDGLARIAARRIAVGDRAVALPLRRALVVMTRRRGATAPEVGRIAGRLLPRNARISTDWQGYADDDACLANTLLAAARDERRLETAAASSLARGLIDGGRWDLVRETLLQLTGRLGRAEAGAPTDPAGEARRLDLVAALAQSMRAGCEGGDAARRRVG